VQRHSRGTSHDLDQKLLSESSRTYADHLHPIDPSLEVDAAFETVIRCGSLKGESEKRPTSPIRISRNPTRIRSARHEILESKLRDPGIALENERMRVRKVWT